MEGKDEIKEFFSQTLNNHELPVRADLWKGIASQMGTTAAVTTTSIWTKLAIATVGLATASMAIYAVVKSDDQQVPPKGNKQTEQKVNQTNKQNPEKENELLKSTSSKQKTEVTEDPVVLKDIPYFGIGQLIENGLTFNQNQPIVSLPDQYFPVDLIENQPQPSIETVSSIGSTNEQYNALSSDPVISQVQELISASEKSDRIGTLSNVFTPNGDHVNDFLSVESTQLSDFQVVVLDRFNKTVFTSTDPGFRWDGIGLSGEPVPSGNYVYFITARDDEGKPINKYSTLRIER